MSALADRLRDKIKRDKAISLPFFMSSAQKYYYNQRDPFGAKGDFITAPEISQMFGELIGLYLADIWSYNPQPFQLVELGAGRGTLMSDLLRAVSIVKHFKEQAEIMLLEQSALLKDCQKKAVPEAHFISDLNQLKPKPLYLIANEFFDALPIRQFEMTPKGWYERQIGLDGEDFIWQIGKKADIDLPEGRIGAIAEICPQAESMIGQIASHIHRFGGKAIIIDYGGEEDYLGDSLQAIYRHAHHPLFEKIGEADITAHLRFKKLISIAKSQGLTDIQLMTQKQFLENLGIQQRAIQLASIADIEEQNNIAAGVKRLTAPSQMGTLFKVMIL